MVSQIMENIDAICHAHSRLGIPLDDVLCALVRQTLRRASADDHQPSLFSEKDLPVDKTDS